jgi:trehalose 6-phosphate phosphatase
MRHILSSKNRDVLEQFACSNVLVALDFDGTLAPIVREPERAAMRPATRAQLRAVARRYPTMVISGRGRADVASRVKGIGLRAVIGNHGIEPGSASGALGARVGGWCVQLGARLASLRGVIVENKHYSVAVHYRASRTKKLAKHAILAAASALGDVRLIGGKQVINILPRDAPHKGMALERARTRFRCDTAIYVGDDETDEDVFQLDQPGQLLGIRVGAKRSSAAAFHLASQLEVDELLRALASYRSQEPSRRRTAR